jgi:chromosome segregation ATPase
MGDSAEFEKLSALESRLAAALDRISRGVAERGAASGGTVPDEAASRAEAAEAARDEAEARAADLAERVAALESRLGETQEALAAAEAKLAEPAASLEADTARIADLEKNLTAREAALAEVTSARDALQKRVEALEDSAKAAAAEDGCIDELERELGVLKRRVERARKERDEAREGRDAAQDLADELAEAPGAEPDARILALRAELRRLRGVVDELSRGLDALRSGGGGGETLNAALEAQVAALTEARRAEAAELDRILADLGAADGAGQEGTEHA